MMTSRFIQWKQKPFKNAESSDSIFLKLRTQSQLLREKRDQKFSATQVRSTPSYLSRSAWSSKT